MPANRKDKRFNDRGANPQHLVFGASGFAAGPMRKPGAARLMNWFYELPPYRWFLPFGGSRPGTDNRTCNHNMRLSGDACQGAILGPKAVSRSEEHTSEL